MHQLTFSVLLIIPFGIFGQEDTLVHRALKEVDVMVSTKSKPAGNGTRTLTRKDIEELSPTDVGELLQKMPGVTVKSYGGLGGLKTVSFRGLGAHHTNISIDGFPLLNHQTGQINLAQIQVDHIESVSTTADYGFDALLPVSTQMAGSAVMIKSTLFSYSEDTIKLRSNFNNGSFGQYDGNGLLKYSRQRFFVSGYGKLRGSEGNYPFALENETDPTMMIRKNNLYQDAFYGFATGVGFRNNTKIRLSYEGKTIDQQLPGAVILYNETADEQLMTTDHTIKADAIVPVKRNVFRIFSVGNLNTMVYHDPTYLNSDGFLRNEYSNESLTGGILFNSSYFNGFRIHGGIEHTFSRLFADGQFVGVPQRQHTYLLVGSKWQKNVYTIHAKLAAQNLENRTNTNDSKYYFRLNPQVLIERKNSSARMSVHQLEYKNTFRPPAFNELYYGNIGNIDLEPENANLISYSWRLNPVKGYTEWETETSIYGSLVENKILAIPTKNLFVWSIQNIGKTGGFGLDVIQSWTKKLNTSMELNLSANYSFQWMMDLTDPEGATYGHQIAYVPMNTANLDLAYSYKGISIRFSNYYVSSRYVLNENIPSNIVEGFVSSDIMLGGVKFAGRNGKITIQGIVKNVFDTQYAYIRSFVMPGRNYLISLKYAIN